MADQAPGHSAHGLTDMQIGLFPGGRAAEAAVAHLKEAGFPEASIHLRRPSQAPHPRYGLGILIGIGGGALMGGLAGLILGILVAHAAPNIGPVDDTASPLVIAGIFLVFGLGSGATAGALFGMDAVADPAHFLNQELQSGHYLVGVSAVGPQQQNDTELALDAAGADDVVFVPLGETLERIFHAEPADEALPSMREPAPRL